MPYILNRRPKPKPPQNNVMTINKALKAVNDTMDWTVLFIVLLLVMVQQGTACPLSCVVSIIFNYQQKATSPVPTSTISYLPSLILILMPQPCSISNSTLNSSPNNSSAFCSNKTKICVNSISCIHASIL